MNPDGLELRVGWGNEGGEIHRQAGGAVSSLLGRSAAEMTKAQNGLASGAVGRCRMSFPSALKQAGV